MLVFQPTPIRPEEKLNKEEKLALNNFDQLDIDGRLSVWHKHLSKFFK
jgi:hypothetical protein